MQFLEISRVFEILGFSKILGFFQRFFGIFDEVYEDFQSNLPFEEMNRWLTPLMFLTLPAPTHVLARVMAA
jgi:hypothetical protein